MARRGSLRIWRISEQAEELGMDMLVGDRDFIAMMEEITERAGKWAEGIVHAEKEPQGFANLHGHRRLR